jgi:hypothetical protein
MRFPVKCTNRYRIRVQAHNETCERILHTVIKETGVLDTNNAVMRKIFNYTGTQSKTFVVVKIPARRSYVYISGKHTLIIIQT